VALKSLETAAELGYNEPFQLLTVGEFGPIRNDEKFKEVLLQVQRNAKAI
jgi:hypothetical protein